MVKLWLGICVCGWLLLGASVPALGGEVTASVDREVVTETDVLVLELSFVEEQTFDLSRLEDNFEILDRQQGFQLRFGADMEPERVHSLQLQLQPRRRGDLTIPALGEGDDRSTPISIRVRPATAESEAERARLAFMEARLSESEVFVQQTLYYDLRVYYRADGVLFGDLPAVPSIAHAVTRAVGGTRRGRTTVDDRDYQYLERRYAVVPQQSGTLRLPPETFTGAIRFDEDGHTVRRNLRLEVDRRQVDVHPQPETWPASQPWLPARNLRLEERVDQTGEMAGVGEPVTRTVLLQADDVPASLMPAINWAPERLQHLNHYPQRAELSETTRNGRLTAERAEGAALLAERPLAAALPAISLYWWDLDAGEVREALLPSRQLKLSGSAGMPLPEPEQAASKPGPQPAEPESATRRLDLPAALLAIYAGIALVTGLLLWWLLPRLPASTSERIRRLLPAGSRETRLRRQLLAACRRDDAATARPLLAAWLAERRRQPASRPLTQLVPPPERATLQPLLDNLDRALYQPGGADWQGRALARWVRTHARSHRRQTAHESAPSLPPLYPHR